MTKRKAEPKGKRLVWRISGAVPLGEWIDLDARPAKVKTTISGEESSRNWIGSTLDLLDGADINDDQDTVPDSLRDEFFPPADTDPKTLDK